MSEPNEPRWITYEQAIAIHSRQLRRFGGAPGLRDQGMLRSALERPINKWRYEQSDMAELAAAYAFGLVLLRHKFIGTRRAIEARQHGHRGKRLTRASMMRRRTVAIEFGT